jgi:beta-phosphoglucomutase-like phosphatase (HAD superfamily)
VTPAGGRPAVLFDVDGTLVDSNYLHVHAWYRAFDEANVEVEAWRIHRSIGMDGSSSSHHLPRAPMTAPARG